jgi:hypothetical protein
MVLVPEIYGWCEDGEEAFLYMELAKESTLEQRRNELSAPERSNICEQLDPMISALRVLKQDPMDYFIGNPLPFRAYLVAS